VEATWPRIAQQRYLGQLEANSADRARRQAEAMELELLCEELQACVHNYSTSRQLRAAVQLTLDAMQRELNRLPEIYQDQQATDEFTAWEEGRAQAYRSAVKSLAEIIGAGER